MLLPSAQRRSSQPLNGELTDRGARLEGVVRTAARYRLHRLDTEPPKPGLVRVRAGGASIEGELWSLPPAALGTLLGGLPQPIALGRVELADGREAVGFLCEPVGGRGQRGHHRVRELAGLPRTAIRVAGRAGHQALARRAPQSLDAWERLSPIARRRSSPDRASARVHGAYGVNAGGDGTLAA